MVNLKSIADLVREIWSRLSEMKHPQVEKTDLAKRQDHILEGSSSQEWWTGSKHLLIRFSISSVVE